MKKYLPILISMLVLSSLSSCNKRKLKEVYDNTEETELLLDCGFPDLSADTNAGRSGQRYAEIKKQAWLWLIPFMLIQIIWICL